MNLNAKVFFKLADAAEKYIVYGAMNTCFTRMQYVAHDSLTAKNAHCIFLRSQLIPSHPVEILNHCDKYDYSELADSAALQTISSSLENVMDGLTHPGLLRKWVSIPFIPLI